MQIFFDRPDQLLKQVWNDKNIHIVEKEHIVGRDKFSLIDISMNAEGQDQDKMFIESAFYKTNIRRGNTLVEITDKGKKKLIWGRKGAQKIIDIRLEYLQSITKGLQLTKDQKKAFEYIFRDVNKCLQSGKRVQLLKTQKANGQNAQVSYCYELDAWIICSKNVSILASREKDIELYQGKRFSYAKVIARQWFKQIQHLDKDKIKRLKKLLDGFTLVGEYCGNPEYQHLILYSEIKIIWFALIDNFIEQYCVDPFQVKRDIEEFGFRFVKLKRMGSWNDKKKFYRELEDLYLKVAQSSMEDLQYGMQGSIVYFLSPQLKGNKPYTKVLGSGKLKTIEYRFFRKIRQKLSRYIHKKQSELQLIRKYEQQCGQLQNSNNSSAPYPQFYYTQVLKKGCQLVRETKITEELLRSKFVSVLKMLFYVISKNISLKSLSNKLIKNQKFLNQITKLPLSLYGTLGCNTKVIYVQVDLPYVPSYNVEKQLKDHFQKLNLRFKHIQSSSFGYDVERIFTEINSTPKNDQKTPFLMHFYITGSLKSEEVLKILQKLKYKGKKDIHHKITIITDKATHPEQFFTDTNNSEYPFKLQTILTSYWKGFQEVKNTPTIQQKIDLLKYTTDELKLKRDFLQDFQKSGMKRFQMQMGRDLTLQTSEKNELSKIISFLVSSQKQYENYCRLILKLEKFSQNNFTQTSEEQTQNEIKSLIKSSFPVVPEVDFVEKQ